MGPSQLPTQRVDNLTAGECLRERDHVTQVPFGQPPAEFQGELSGHGHNDPFPVPCASLRVEPVLNLPIDQDLA